MAKVVHKKDPVFEQITLALKELEGKQAKAGWFETAKYENGTPVAYVATIQEFGCPENGIPSRPFMRPAIAKYRDEWSSMAKKGAKAILKGAFTASQVMEMIAMRAASDVAKEITEVTSPPLKPATIAARLRKKSDKSTIGNLTKPLVDTGLMLATPTAIVEDS